MLGKASCTIIASSTVMKLPASSTARPSQRRPCAGAATGAFASGQTTGRVSITAMGIP